MNIKDSLKVIKIIPPIKLDVDNKHDVTVFVDHVKLDLTRFDYLLLMKILYNNILYDDGND